MEIHGAQAGKPVGFFLLLLGKQACDKCDALVESQLFDTKEEALEARARWSTTHAQYRTARVAALYELNDPAT